MLSVSVIVPCYNAAAWISHALSSLDAQGVDALQVIVVDDGSTDASAAIVARDFPNVYLIRTSNGGASRARNIGIQAARGEFIQFLDADDWLPAHKISTQLKLLQETGEDVAYCDWQRVLVHADGTMENQPVVSRNIRGDPAIALFTDGWYPNLAYLFRRTIVERVGGFNESLPIIQDARFAVDCALHGASFVYTPGIVVPYRIHSTTQNSKRDPRAFDRDVFTNAQQVQEWWQEHGGITPERRGALLQAYAYVARSSYEQDRPTFETAYAHLVELDPHYRPRRPRHLAFAALLLGYRRAEYAALWYRRGKQAVRRLFFQPHDAPPRAQRSSMHLRES